MAPIEGHQTPMLAPPGMQVAQLNAAPTNSAGGTISLIKLLEFLLQKTYHELTILAELLPRKTDMERKLEIANFSHRVRHQFIRCLALIKWAASANKVEKCASITNFLEKQSMLFIDTADMLSVMARDTLVHARLPSFHLPAAIEVLTLGQYSRLPACIREKIVPPDPITPQEKRTTLLRLNQIIEYRLVSSEFPIQMKNLTIENGRVTFYVPHEFKACLTLMGDSPTIAWRLLEIVIQVEDKETGDGKNLVHTQQLEYLRLLVQSRLTDNTRPLHDLYNCLHTFCVSLQLEVLVYQAQRLIMLRLGNTIKVEEYRRGSFLVILYWTSLTSGQQYKLFIQADASDSNKPLQLRHEPPLTSKDSMLAEQAIRSDHLSLEKLLMHTIHIRSKHRLRELQLKLKDFECSVMGSPPILHVALLPSVSSENLLITVDAHAGLFMAHVPQYDPPMIKLIQNQLNKNPNNLLEQLNSLKYWIMLRRCEKTIQHLPVTVTEHLSLYRTPGDSLQNLTNHVLYVKLCRHPNYYVVVELKSLEEICYYLMVVKPNDEEIFDLPKCYLKVTAFLTLDTFAVTHGPCTQVEEALTAHGKRKMKSSSTDGPQSKKPKLSSLFVAELAHVIAMCDARLPFTALTQELNKKKICHQGIQVEANGYTICVRIVKMPHIEGVDESVLEALHNTLLTATIHLQGKGTRIWLVEFVFGNCPLVSQWNREQGARRPVVFMYEYGSGPEEMVRELLQDWATMGRVYGIALELSRLLVHDNHNLQVEVRSFTYRRLILAYGPNKASTMALSWRPSDSRFQLSFAVAGVSAPSGSNPHTLVVAQLQQEFNKNKCIGQLIQNLNDTYSPLLSLSKLPAVPQLGIITSRPNIPVPTFLIIPQTSTHYRVVYRHIFCLDIQVRADGLLAVKDGAYSVFDKGKAVEEYFPIQMLKGFLSKSGDDVMGHLRRRSQSDDDNPLSPGPSLDAMDSLFLGSNQIKPGSPATSLRQEGLRFHNMALTPPSGSNPHTPASPHPCVLSQQQSNYGTSPNPSFSLASPPSLSSSQPTPQQSYVTPSPSMLHMQAQSPGNLFAASSPVNPLHVPSPSFLPQPSPSSVPNVPMPSPATFGGHADGGSPFPASSTNLSMSSPAAWPGSPSVPRPSPRGTAQSPGSSTHPALHSPQAGNLHTDHMKNQGVSRVPSQRHFSATLPMLLSSKGLDYICSPSIVQHTSPVGLDPQNSPLERFMGCVFIRRHLHRTIQGDEQLVFLTNTEPGVIQFKVETLQLRVNFNMATLQALHMKATPNLEYKDQWTENELQTLERYCDLKVLNAPYKPNYFLAFSRLLNAPLPILKNCINLIRLELVPDRTLKWTFQLCLTIPPINGASAGMTAIMVKDKMLFFLQLTRMGHNIPPGMESQTVVIPIVYDINQNTTLLATTFVDRSIANQPQSSPLNVARNILKRFADYSPQSNEISIFPAIRELMANLVIPM